MAAPAFDFPTSDRLGKAAVEREFLRVSDRRAADPHLHFSLMLPKTWRPMDLPAAAPEADGGPVRLALYHPDGEDGQATAIDVAVVKLSREVDPADWLDLFLEASGLTVVNRRDAPAEGGRIPDRLTLNLDPANPQVARWLVLKNGPHLFVVQARTSVDRYLRLAEVFFFAATQFQLLDPLDWPLAESLATFSRHDPGNFLLMYPASWERQGDPFNHPTFLELTILNPLGGKSLGQLYFATAARTPTATPAKLVEEQVRAFEKAGVFAAPSPLGPGPAVEGIPETWLTTFPAAGKGEVFDVHLFVGQRPEWSYLLCLLTPTRRAMPSVWAINKRAFEVCLKYFKAAPRGEPPAQEPKRPAG